MDHQAATPPFPRLSDGPEFDRDYVALLNIACDEGYLPREGPCSCIDLGTWPQGRSVSLVRRGMRNGWEPFLGDSGKAVRLGPYYRLAYGEHACVCLRPPYRASACFALEWMRGQSLESILQNFEFIGGSPAGITLRSAEARADARQRCLRVP